MTEWTDRLLIVAALGVLALTIWFASATPARSTNGETTVPTSTAFHALSRSGEAEGSLRVHAGRELPPGTTLFFDVRRGRLWEPKGQPEARAAAGIEATFQRNRDLLDIHESLFDDWGTYAGGVVSRGGGGLHVGLRLSPARMLYGVLAPDVMAGEHEVGAGVVVFPPPDLLGSWLSHWGVGLGHLWSTSDGSSSTAVYLAFSTYE